MTDVNEEVPSIPVDNVDAPMTVSDCGCLLSLSAVSRMGGARVDSGHHALYRGRDRVVLFHPILGLWFCWHTI